MAAPRGTESELSAYHAAVARLDELIAPAPPADRSPAAIRVRAERRLERVRRFLVYLGQPQDAYPIVHVGGTSGKGSTSTMIAGMLTAAGYRVGLHTSPYLQVATEKLQLDGRLIAPAAFAALVDEILSAAAAWVEASKGEEDLTYGEAWTALATRWFEREAVDVAVIEVGAGGRFDLTNVVRPAVSVITTVGLDHVETLGGTIPEIAWHKAGIIKAGAPAVTAVIDPAALGPIAAEAATAGTTLTRVVPGRTFEILGTDPTGTRWRELDRNGAPGPSFVTALPGRFQAGNAATALAAVRALAERGLVVGEEAARVGMAQARLPGRWEPMPGQARPRVILDGAHNPDKLGALADALPALLDLPRGARLVVVLGALEGKAVAEMAGRLAPRAAAIVATVPSVLGKAGIPAAELASAIRATGFTGPVLTEADPDAAIAAAVAMATGPDDAVLVTGSLYLVGHVRRRWFPNDEILLQRTPWPRRT